MNRTKILKACLLSMVVTSFALVQAADVETIRSNIKSASSTNLNKYDQAFCIFKTTLRHPLLIVAKPASNSLESFDFGTKDIDGTIRQVTVGNAADLERMFPIHYVNHMVDANLKIEQNYVGWADKVLEVAAEDALRTFHILNTKPSTKNPFMVQAVNHMPMKIVVKNAADFEAFRKYLTLVYAQNNFVPTEKSVLVLEIEDMSKDLTAADYLFLDTYFDVKDLVVDEEINAFFAEAQAFLDERIELRHHSTQIGKGFGEGCMDQIKKLGSLNMYDHIALFLVATAGTWAVKKAFDAGKIGVDTVLNLPEVSERTKVITDEIGSMSTTDKVIAGAVALLGSYVVMKLINLYLESDNDSDRQALLEELSAALEKKAKEQNETQENVVIA
ncbi:MAG: hypothetical protein ABH827_03270 [bacterium]